MSSGLKPCPFCGGEAFFEESDTWECVISCHHEEGCAVGGWPEPMTFHAESTRKVAEVRKRKYELQKVSDARLRERLLADEADERHGTMRGYHLGCRCGRCRNAMRLHCRMVKTRELIKDAGRNPWTGGRL